MKSLLLFIIFIFIIFFYKKYTILNKKKEKDTEIRYLIPETDYTDYFRIQNLEKLFGISINDSENSGKIETDIKPFVVTQNNFLNF